jgi:outer membrane receptor for monomeric catechols
MRNREAGVKTSVLEDRLDLKVGFFWVDRDASVISIRDGAFFENTNAGEHEHKSVASGATDTPTDPVAVCGNVAF